MIKDYAEVLLSKIRSRPLYYVNQNSLFYPPSSSVIQPYPPLPVDGHIRKPLL